MELQPGAISRHSVLSRIRINNHNGFCENQAPPLHEIEAMICDFCIRLARMGQGFSKEEVIELASELIKETIHEQHLNECKLLRKIELNNGLGDGWWRGFLKRNKGKIETKKSKVQDASRQSWCTYNNFKNMYDEVYDCMVEAGVAVKLDHEVMQNKEGNVVYNKEESFGRPSRYQVPKPEYILFVEETGSNTNQKDDGLEGGQKVVAGTDQTEGACIGSTTDIHFTVLCFTSGTGEPVMFGIILKSEKKVSELHFSITLGVDITKNELTGRTQAETFQLNSNEDGSFRGGPICRYQGRIIPCFVETSKKARITPDILVDMLRELDKSGLYDRTDGCMPFLLLDGHHSRMKLSFLIYITTDDHRWMVCVGVPYGTHLWQVADSSELNGCFKMQLTKAKKRYRKLKPTSNKSFETSDVIPLVNHGWGLSFARADKAKAATASRGWGPLNYMLLDHPSLIKFSKTTPSSVLNQHEERTILEVNLTGKETGAHLDAIFEDNKLSASRQKAWEENKNMSLSQEERFKDMREGVGNLTSGKLVKNDMHCISTREIYNHVCEHDESKKKIQQEVMDRKNIAQDKFDIRLKESVERFKDKSKQLRLEDIKTLTKGYQKDGDLPLRGRYLEAKKQWEDSPAKKRLDINCNY